MCYTHTHRRIQPFIVKDELINQNDYLCVFRDVNPILNCVVDNRFDLALAEARAIDARLRVMTEEEKRTLFEEKPFLGIPFTIKDCFEVEGLSWTAGLWYRRNEKVEPSAFGTIKFYFLRVALTPLWSGP